MRKYISLAMGMMMTISAAYSQSVTFPENFDGNTSTFTSSPASAWKIDANYYINPPNSIRGVVPNMMGDSVVLTSPVYDLSNYQYVLLRFNHICKVSSQDITRIEYKISGQSWQPVPTSSYIGKAILYQTRGFNANSYTEWNGNDSLTLPLQSWWKEEMFDVSFETGTEDEVQFRFVIQHGNVAGTQISYGWLIDNIEIMAASYEIMLPVVEFLTPLAKGTVYSTGPYEINAKVKTATTAQIETPWFVYTATNSKGTVKDSVLMTMVRGDSLWKANIPQFILGTEVVYSITGKDRIGNTASATSGYVIAKPNHSYGDVSVSLTSIVSPIKGQTIINTNTPIEVILRNRGDSVLTAATVHWSINGVTRQPYSWTGNLLWDFEQQITIGSYQPSMGQYDTIVIWVSMPNGMQDIVLTDDTLTVIAYGCSARMSGSYTVGQGGVFPDLKEALTALSLCSPTGNISFLLQTGIYPENWDLTNSGDLIGNYILTITSAASNADSVILRPASGVNIKLANSNNLVLKAITVDAISNGNNAAIRFYDACTNVTIRDCKLLTGPTSTNSSTALVYKGERTGVVDNIFIINNLLDGGYYGITFVGGTDIAYGTHLVFDSNVLTNQYRNTISTSYADFTSCSYNTILSRIVSAGAAWYGLNLVYTNGHNITGNRIIQQSAAITQPYGIYLQYFNYYNTTDTGLIVNNEIILNTTGTYSGIYLRDYTVVKILHNSIYVSGTGAARGIQSGSIAYNTMVIKNNNIVTESVGSFPVYISAVNNSNFYDIDCNNMYSPTYIGYAGLAKTNLTAWQQTVITDLHSISVRPDFIDSSIHLKVANYLSLYTSALPEVDVDIDNVYRTGILTSMGCYHGIVPYSVNASLGNISGFRMGGVFGQQDSLKVELFNIGTTALTAAVLKWSLNGVTQSVAGTAWSGSLSFGQNTMVTLGAINYTQTGDNIIRVWIDNLGSFHDEFVKDDTTSISIYICQNTLSGSYTIGSGGAFPTWDAAMDHVKLCGVGGDIIFEFLPNVYTMYFDLTDNSSLFGNYTLTITSSTHKAESVVFKTTNYGVLLNNSHHIIIDAVTIDAIAGNYAVQFTNAATNIAIRNCILLMDSVINSNSKYIIYKASGTDIASNISITHNIINGGSYGIYFYAGINTFFGNHIVVDSNTFKNQYRHGIYFYYLDSASISNNRIISRENNAYNIWYGMEILRFNGYITGNHIFQRSNDIGRCYGISVQYFNSSFTSDTGLIANNEIILNATSRSSICKGIAAENYTIAKILHNSIYINGNGLSRGLDIFHTAGNNMMIKNNNIIMKSTVAYPIFLNSIANLALYDMDYNNMYAPVFAGYCEENISTIADWQRFITTDHNSVSILPDFIDPSNKLTLTDYRGLFCSRIAQVTTDINGETRSALTTMGCYESLPSSVNAMLAEITGIREGHVLSQTDTVKVVVYNTGTMPLASLNLEWSVNGVSQNAGGTTYTVPLNNRGSFTTIALGTLAYPVGEIDIKIWINSLNGGGLIDEVRNDDTVSKSLFICNAPFSGLVTIGANANSDFQTFQQFYTVLSLCGANGDITVAFEPGIYNESLNIRDNAVRMSNYRLTLTSSNNNADSVIIRPPSGSGVILSHSKNIVLRALTIDAATSGTNAIEIVETCTNIVVRDCRLLADTTATTNIYNSVYKEVNTGTVDSIFFINNLLDGGYHGIYFDGSATTSLYGTNIVFDSNTVSNSISFGIYLYYVDFTSCSYNMVLSRTANTNTMWYGLRLEHVYGPVIGNRIIQRSNLITQSRGIYSIYHNETPTVMIPGRGLIANNEIRLNIATSVPAIFAQYSKLDILHNSLYISGTAGAQGIHIENNTTVNNMAIKNNNIVMETSDMYPIYITTASNLNLYDIGYNNMYAPNYVGYVGGAKANLTAWQQTLTTDLHSISVRPSFIDSSVSLELDDFSPLLCPSNPNVTVDIQKFPRIATTVMGAYSSIVSNYDLMLQNITRMEDEVVNNQTIYVGIQAASTGQIVDIDSAIFRYSINGVTQLKSYKWIPSTPLQFGETEEILIDSFKVTGTSDVTVNVWAEKINNGKDSIAFDDTVSKTAIVVPLARFASPVVADTLHALSFNVYVKIIEGSGALFVTPVPKMKIQTQMGNGTVLYDTIDMVHNNGTGLWIAYIPQQYYGSKVIYSITISDTVGNSIPLTGETYLQFVSGGEAYNGTHIAVIALQGLIELGQGCIPDYVTATVTLSNMGTADYNFSANPVKLYIQVTQPEPFYLDTLISSGIMRVSENMAVKITNMFPTVVAGQYDVKIWIDSLSPIVDDDTLVLDYISGKFGLPVDEDFSSDIPIVFASNGINSFHKWDTISQGTGADTAVIPQFGTGMLVFTGSAGSMSTLSTQQLDLSRTVQPSLSFWYFHDTIPCEDYTDVRITVDGGTAYNTLFSLTKYNPVYGWQQYSMDLPPRAVNECVILVFEAMEKSRSGDVTQYIDRILITAKQDIAVTEIITSEIAACDLENKEVKVVLSNLTDPVLDFATTPTTLTLEILESGQTYSHLLDSGSLGRFASDTITIATGIDFAKGTYTLKAYFSSVLDVDRMNDTLVTSIVINPALSVSVHPESSPANCLTGELVVNPTITLYNTGNMDLSGIDLVLQVDTGENNPDVYVLLKETYTGSILAGDTATYMFTNSYTVPWNARYDVRTYVYLSCDSAMVNSTNMVQECVDIKDLRIISIDNPSATVTKDVVGSSIPVTVTLNNRSDGDIFTDIPVNVRITNSQGIEQETFMETQTVGASATISHAFTRTYTVPNDSVYYLIVFVNSQDNYHDNDTLTMKRYTESVGIETLKGSNGFTLGQNIPNPANNRTRIDYSIPETGEVVFNLHSVSGQLLYSQTIEATNGKQSLELNTSSFAAGIYFYSIEYKGQRLVKRMMISD
jgi:hypothetical protein